MPTYQYICDTDDEGCGSVIEVTCRMSNREENIPKSCPECHMGKALHQLFGYGSVYVPTTLGSMVDKNTDKLSVDEKHHLKTKHNKYREHDGQPSFVNTPEGLVHRSKLE